MQWQLLAMSHALRITWLRGECFLRKGQGTSMSQSQSSGLQPLLLRVVLGSCVAWPELFLEQCQARGLLGHKQSGSEVQEVFRHFGQPQHVLCRLKKEKKLLHSQRFRQAHEYSLLCLLQLPK